MTRFSPEQVRRYSRHVLLPDVGGVGQGRLLAAAVAVDVGGAAARIAAAYLVAAGVGHVALIGPLERPAISAGFPLAADAAGRPLGAALAAALAGRNPDVRVTLGAVPDAAQLTIVDDRDDLPLDLAFARGAEAAARLVHRLATGATP
jgi:molybdopterin/thiamine biosynthesis adenylyltransferase